MLRYITELRRDHCEWHEDRWLSKDEVEDLLNNTTTTVETTTNLTHQLLNLDPDMLPLKSRVRKKSDNVKNRCQPLKGKRKKKLRANSF